MAAFLTVDVLRAHAAPCLPLGTFGRAGNFAWPHRSLRRRPVLIMRWLIAPDGRLTCLWRSDVSALFGPPPH